MRCKLHVRVWSRARDVEARMCNVEVITWERQVLVSISGPTGLESRLGK